MLGNISSTSTPISSKRKPSLNNISVPSTSTQSAGAPPIFHKAVVIQDQAITQRRLEYVETQLKKSQIEFKDHVTMLQDHRKSFKEDVDNLEMINIQPIQAVAKMNIVGQESGKRLYNKGDVVPLVYPMKKDGTKTLMRTLLIDPVTAQFSYEWVVVFDMDSGKPIRPITNFSLCGLTD
jgi:hypothetical protein